MEEVLFGRETAATAGVEPGLLEQAHGGVVYFDEVADMPLGTQSKILRVLVEQQFSACRAGTDKVRVDLRVDLVDEPATSRPRSRAGRFRQELYRPPERRSDPRAVARGAARGHPRTRRAISSRCSTATQGLPLRDPERRSRGAAADHALARATSASCAT